MQKSLSLSEIHSIQAIAFFLAFALMSLNCLLRLLWDSHGGSMAMLFRSANWLRSSTAFFVALTLASSLNLSLDVGTVLN